MIFSIYAEFLGFLGVHPQNIRGNSFKLATTISVYPYKTRPKCPNCIILTQVLPIGILCMVNLCCHLTPVEHTLCKPDNDAMPQGNPSSSDPSPNKKRPRTRLLRDSKGPESSAV